MFEIFLGDWRGSGYVWGGGGRLGREGGGGQRGDRTLEVLMKGSKSE